MTGFLLPWAPTWLDIALLDPLPCARLCPEVVQGHCLSSHCPLFVKEPFSFHPALLMNSPSITTILLYLSISSLHKGDHQ